MPRAVVLASWRWGESGHVGAHPFLRKEWATSPPRPTPQLSVPGVKWAQGFFLHFFLTPNPLSLNPPNSSGTISPLETAELVPGEVQVTDKATSPRDSGTSTPSQA